MYDSYSIVTAKFKVITMSEATMRTFSSTTHYTPTGPTLSTLHHTSATLMELRLSITECRVHKLDTRLKHSRRDVDNPPQLHKEGVWRKRE